MPRSAWSGGAPVVTSRFEQDTAVERVGDGRHRGVVDPGWAVIDGAAANGGYLMALAARAMRDPLPAHPYPAPGYLAGWFATHAVIDGYLEEDGEVWDAEGDLVVLSRQLALPARPRHRG